MQLFYGAEILRMLNRFQSTNLTAGGVKNFCKARASLQVQPSKPADPEDARRAPSKSLRDGRVKSIGLLSY